MLNGCVSVRYSEYGSDTLGHDYWVVKTGFTYQVDRDTHVYVPEGFLTDGASVPNWLSCLIPPWGNHGMACVVHDHLCEYLQVWRNGERVSITRDECDKIFHKCLLDTGVGKLKANVMYGAVKAYSHLKSIVSHSYNPHKHATENFILQNYRVTGNWM